MPEGSGPLGPTATADATADDADAWSAVDAAASGDVTPVPDPDAPTPTAKDSLLDLIRITAIGRVVLWHTWSWAWLTWIPAMPAMFFVTGALLDGSLGRRGWWPTVRSRLRRLLIPYWAYAAACWAVMLLDGWRPTVGDAARWAVPLWDPVGSDQLPGLWIPLWYLRAYLWFLLASGVIRALQRKLGVAAMVASTAAAAGLWFWGRHGLDVPLPVGDFVTYLPFVVVGLGYGASRTVPRRSVLVALAVASAVAAFAAWQRYGPSDGVVNRSYLLTMLVGLAGVAAVFAARGAVLRATAGASDAVARVNSRALTIYLWQGFGLVAAQRLVDQRLDPGPLRVALSLVVVVVVIAGAVAAFGRIEDFAAGRLRHTERGRARDLLRLRSDGRRLAALAPAAAVVTVALVVPVRDGALVEAPLSGQAVIARGSVIEEQLDKRLPTVDVSGLTSQQVLEEWVAEHRSLLERIGTDWIDAAIAQPDGTIRYVSWNEGSEALPPTIAWWSMTKAITSAWLARTVDDGIVGLDDPLSDHVPEAPRAHDMTLAQLASHTAGVPPELDGDLFDAHPAEELDAFIERGELSFEPGTGYGYSRVGYYLLALALERATGSTWQEAMSEMASAAGVTLRFDDELRFADPVSDPDGHGYHGGLWSSGGLVSSVEDGAALLHWLFTDGLSPRAIDAMTRFPADSDRNYYGLALVPMCPCEIVGDHLRSDRFGLDTASGTFAVDRPTGAAVMVRPEDWWADDGPATEFYDLQQRLLDSVTS